MLPIAQLVPVVLRWAPWVIVVVAIMFGVWERGSAASSAAALSDFKAKSAQAVVDQKIADAATSSRLLSEQAVALTQLHTLALSNVQKALNAPVTNSCGPAVRDAARGLRDSLRGSGK